MIESPRAKIAHLSLRAEHFHEAMRLLQGQLARDPEHIPLNSKEARRIAILECLEDIQSEITDTEMEIEGVLRGRAA